MIEPAWNYLKNWTTACGAASSQKALEARWIQKWRQLPQQQIQQWIEQIPRHLEKIRMLKGRNEYKEEQTDEKVWKNYQWKKQLQPRIYWDRQEFIDDREFTDVDSEGDEN